MAAFIGYPRGKVLAAFDSAAAATTAERSVQAAGIAPSEIERFEGPAAADQFDASGARHGIVARSLRAMQFSLMDQLPAMAWYEAALREGKTVLAVRSGDRAATLTVVDALRGAGGHFINHFGRVATEEFERWRGPEPAVPSLMKH